MQSLVGAAGTGSRAGAGADASAGPGAGAGDGAFADADSAHPAHVSNNLKRHLCLLGLFSSP